MEIWTRYNSQIEWRQWPKILSGIEGLLQDEPVEVLFLSERPLHEIDQFISGIAIVRRICGESVSVIVASPYPSEQWISRLRTVGIDQVWTVSSRQQRYGQVSPEQVSQLTNAACPALHAREHGGKAISVCGCHSDRMVLAHHHLKRWCLKNKDECPHWNEDRMKMSLSLKAEINGNH
ncbi:MAG: hypothetical protein JXX14_20245 [Deltaproteobacteria bacterium]|nr:hypothetical protein [Deltaproteobacteria bacterium]